MKARVRIVDMLASDTGVQSLFYVLHADLKDMHGISIHSDCRG